MSTHLEYQLDDVDTELEQLFTLQKDVTLVSVALKLNIFNDPVGTFILNVRKNGTPIATKTLTVSEINLSILEQVGSVELYKLGYISFEFDNPINLKRNTEYSVHLTSAGYSFSASSSLGWIKEYLNETNKLTDTPVNDLGKSFSYRLWGYQNA